jgi:hypothetical protein
MSYEPAPETLPLNILMDPRFRSDPEGFYIETEQRYGPDAALAAWDIAEELADEYTG